MSWPAELTYLIAQLARQAGWVFFLVVSQFRTGILDTYGIRFFLVELGESRWREP